MEHQLMPAMMITQFGTHATAYWKAGTILVAVGVGTPVTVTPLATESGVDILEDATGVWYVLYVDATGAVKRMQSIDHGATWS
jgi:hypothetical protein